MKTQIDEKYVITEYIIFFIMTILVKYTTNPTSDYSIYVIIYGLFSAPIILGIGKKNSDF